MDKVVDGVRIAMTATEEAEQARIAALPRRRTKAVVRRQLGKHERKAAKMMALALGAVGPLPPEVREWIDTRAALEAEMKSL